MINIALKVEYDGSCFNGWQRQCNAPSVQQTLEEALEKVMGTSITLYGAGRTDAGVHALGQICNFRCQTNIPPDRLAYVLNRELPPSIRIQRSFKVPGGFHARFLARGKHYRYILHVSEFPSALWNHRAWQIRPPLNFNAMVEAAPLLIGEHDFAAFCASGSAAKSTVRTLYDVKITRQGSEIYFDFYGSGFLYNMVRILVGTLVYVGQGKLTVAAVEELLVHRDRRKGGITAPACGLYMVEVFYSRRYICFFKSLPWPKIKAGFKCSPIPKFKRLQLSHACHKPIRVFVGKTGENKKSVSVKK